MTIVADTCTKQTKTNTVELVAACASHEGRYGVKEFTVLTYAVP